MAGAEVDVDVEEEEYEVKDEELVDFEGSDYGFESADELEEEEAENNNNGGAEDERVVSAGREKDKEKEKEKGGDDVDVDVDVVAAAVAMEEKEGVESGEIEEENDEEVGNKKGSVVVEVSRQRRAKVRKADLEDGELDDAAMPEGSDPEAEVNSREDDEEENDRRERKRRKDRFAAERHLETKERKDAEELALAQSRQYRGRGSDKMHAGRGNSYPRGVRGANGSLTRANLGPGIMGPGRPPVPMEFGGPIPMRPMGRGFPRPIGGIIAPGRPSQNEINMQTALRDMAAHEQYIRSHQMMQMAQEQVHVHQAQVQAQAQAQQALAQAQAQAQAHAHAQAQQAHAHAQAHMANSGQLRAPLNANPMRPMMGLEFIGGQVPASHAMMHLQVQTPDAGQQLNFLRPMEGFGGRVSRGMDPFPAGRGAGGGSLVIPPSNRDRTAVGRQQNAWSSPSLSSQEVQNMSGGRGRGQSQGRGQVISPLWGDPQVAGMPTGFPSSLGVIGHAVPVNVGSGMAPGGMVSSGAPKRGGSLPVGLPGSLSASREGSGNSKKVDARSETDGTWRDGGHRNNNGTAPHSRGDSGAWSNGTGAHMGNKRNRENGLERRHSFAGSLTGGKAASLGNGMGLNATNAGNHLIQLGGPVTKSRVVSVSGFPENTSMAVVVEAFEKQGKILDFKKDERGNAFHITFSNEAEAVSAKRSLHRSLLNGRQITVEYAVQRY